MAKVATQPAPTSLDKLAGGALKVGGGSGVGKRKTPSELRGEQLKKTNVVEIVDESPSPLCGLMNSNGLKKPDIPRNPRYMETRMDEVYPAKKSRLRVLSAKENAKENISIEQTVSMKNVTMLSNLAAKRKILCSENAAASSVVSEVGKTQARQAIEKCSQTIFRSVAELSTNGEKSSGLEAVDMDKALKGLFAHELPASSTSTAEISKNFVDSSVHLGNFLSECPVSGLKAPLDFTLKTKMRVTSSCSVNWIHKSMTCNAYNGMPQSISQFGFKEDAVGSGKPLTSQILSSKGLHSWVYPQSTLPPSVISVLSSQATDGDFLRQRQLGWQDSFLSLYYMLRKNICNIFYVCTSPFVVMFICSSSAAGTKPSCDAYISQSTRRLRSLLREHDVSFSMPLCHSKEEQATTDDLLELSEIEKQNLGQTRRQTSFSDVDNCPESLLAFRGNRNVHALFDFLINYRFSLTVLSGVDVPVLYSPVPFRNAALSSPEIKCVEMKGVDNTFTSPNGKSLQGLSSGFRSKIEIKDAYIPSWIVCRLCSLLGSEGNSFEASFITERTSIGLNIALQTLTDKTNSKDTTSKDLLESNQCLGIAEATVTPCLGSGFVKGLRYVESSYTALLSPM